MQIRVCDRCVLQVTETPDRLFVAGVTIPAPMPAGQPGMFSAVPVTLSIAVKSPADLCPACRRSAVVEYLAQDISANSSPDETKALLQRLRAVLKS